MRNRILSLILLILTLLTGLYAGYEAWQQYRPAIVVEWQTETEVDTAGFRLSRAAAPDGPFVQLNTELIPATGNAVAGASYSYTDHAVAPGQVYYYQLDEIDINGIIAPQGITQAQAERGGLVQAIFAVLLLGSAAYFAFTLLRPTT